jgi:alpha-galactosidase
VAVIAIIGAGSVEFTRSILSDLASYAELHGSLTIRLHDIDAERLTTAELAAGQLVAQTGSGYEIESCPGREAALDGANYVINEIQVGGYAATVTDFEIPRRFGVRQTIADTIGIGGIFRGLRTIPVMLGIGGDMARLCPGALLLNYANPMAMLPWAVWEGTAFANVVGVCHSVRDTQAFLARTVGVPVGDVAFTTAGFNHQAFVLRFEHAVTGEDLYPRLWAAVQGDPEGLGRRTRVEVFRRFGYFPTESSEHTAEYVPWFLRHDEEVERFRIPVDEYIRRSEENLAEYKETKRAVEAGEHLDLETNNELASQIIRAIETDTSRTVAANVRNEGIIDGYPDACCVDVPATVNGSGVHPIRVGRMPVQLEALNRTFLNVVQLTVRAALEERRDLVYDAALLDPNTSAHLTTEQTVAMCDELIRAHAALLPEGIRRGGPR